jgi:Flp pilus assembly protein TadD
VELDPEDAVAHNNLGMLLEQQGYKKEADDRFARADKLSKMEDELYAVMDNLEDEEVDDSKMTSKDGVESRKTTISEDSLKAQFDERTAKASEKANQNMESTDTTENNASKDSKSSKEFKKVFTSRQQFREFLRFIKNGFKLK